MSRTDDIRARMRQLEAELAQLERFPDPDDMPEGTIITWTKVSAGSRFSYVAIRVNDLWWPTGRRWQPASYDSLIALIGDASDARVVLPTVGVLVDVFRKHCELNRAPMRK